MRLTTDISSTHLLVPESHHLTRNRFFPMPLLLLSRTLINRNRRVTGGPSPLPGTGATLNLIEFLLRQGPSAVSRTVCSDAA
jgi:hypothetical protein